MIIFFVISFVFSFENSEFLMSGWLHNKIPNLKYNNANHLTFYSNNDITYLNNNDSTKIYKSTHGFKYYFKGNKKFDFLFTAKFLKEQFMLSEKLFFLNYFKKNNNFQSQIIFRGLKYQPAFELLIDNNNLISYGTNVKIVLKNNLNIDFTHLLIK